MRLLSFLCGAMWCWCLIMAAVTFAGRERMHRFIDWVGWRGQWWWFALMAWLFLGALWLYREQKK